MEGRGEDREPSVVMYETVATHWYTFRVVWVTGSLYEDLPLWCPKMLPL